MVLRVGYATRPVVVTPRRSAPDILDLRTRPPRRVLPPAPDKAMPRARHGGPETRGE
jgi:hypothetical protein